MAGVIVGADERDALAVVIGEHAELVMEIVVGLGSGHQAAVGPARHTDLDVKPFRLGKSGEQM